MHRFFKLVPALFLLFTFSCKKEVARLDVKSDPAGKLRVFLEKEEEVELWTDVDIAYLKKPSFMYDFEIVKSEKVLNKGGIDPLAVVNDKAEDFMRKGEKIRWRLKGQLPGVFVAKEDGMYEFKVTFINNASMDLEINKLDLNFISIHPRWASLKKRVNALF